MDEEPVEIPISDVFDLHSFPPRDAKAALEAYLEEAHHRGFRALRIIHGRGIGVQREMVRTVLARTPFVSSFSDAPMEAGGWGATIVTLGERGEEPMAATAPQMNEEVSRLLRQYDDTLADAEALAATLNSKQFNWRDEPGQWSVGECFEHLTLFTRAYQTKVRVAIDDGKRRGLYGGGPFRYGWFESYFLRVTEPPPKFRVKAPKVFRPMPPQAERVLDAGATLVSYRESNRAMRALVAEANGLDLRRIKAASPATDLIKWSLGIILAIVPAHDRRHLWQARQMTLRAGFPR